MGYLLSIPGPGQIKDTFQSEHNLGFPHPMSQAEMLKKNPSITLSNSDTRKQLLAY